MQAKSKRILAFSLILCIILITNISRVYASDSKSQVMIYKDGKFIWVDSDSEEAKARFGSGSVDISETEKKKNEIASAPNEVIAKPTNQRITVDGLPTSFRAYNINGYNYFMLRDIAHIFKGSKAQFEVGWDQARFAINLETGKNYTGAGVGFEMKTPHVEEKGSKSKATIYKNGEEALLLGYTIQGYTYFKLRDLGDDLGFGVDWDNTNQTVVLLSDKDAKIPQPEPEKKPEQKPQDNKGNENPLSKVDTTPTSESKKQEMRETMLALINKERKKAGLAPLVLDDKLTEMAQYKSDDMHKLDAMTHKGSYGSFQDLLSKFNINYTTAGENILMRGVSAGEMFDTWWDSSGHKANMMNPKFKKIGIGFTDYKPITKGMKVLPEDLKDVATYDELLGIYKATGMGYWATQEFTD